MLREAVKNRTELGRKAEGYMSRGELVPDELIIGLIEDKITAGELNGGFILDGFPRTMAQAQSLQTMFQKNGIALDRAVLLKVSDEEIVRRIAGRAAQEGRADDTEEVVRRRLEVYNAQTRPLEGFYEEASILAEIDGERSMETVYEAVLGAVK
jgi:adenylate kinase